MALPWAIQQIKDLFAKFPVAVTDGGTGLTAHPAVLTYLSSNQPDTVFKGAPTPGVIGTLQPPNGGTGVNSLAQLKAALGIDTSGAAAPLPKSGAGVGQVVSLGKAQSPLPYTISLPSGGQWMYWWAGVYGGVTQPMPGGAGVAAGGTRLVNITSDPMDISGPVFIGWAWRIA